MTFLEPQALGPLMQGRTTLSELAFILMKLDPKQKNVRSGRKCGFDKNNPHQILPTAKLLYFLLMESSKIFKRMKNYLDLKLSHANIVRPSKNAQSLPKVETQCEPPETSESDSPSHSNRHAIVTGVTRASKGTSSHHNAYNSLQQPSPWDSVQMAFILGQVTQTMTSAAHCAPTLGRYTIVTGGFLQLFGGQIVRENRSDFVLCGPITCAPMNGHN